MRRKASSTRRPHQTHVRPDKDLAREWMTDEIIRLLGAIPEPHAPKKRVTVIRLAFARANQQPLKDVFNQKDTCAEVIWYTKWRFMPDIQAAFEACYKRALQFADEQTVQIEDHYRRERKQSLAVCSAKAPEILLAVGQDANQRGMDRIKAANDLMSWADPDVAEQVKPNYPFEPSVREVMVELSRDGAEGDKAAPPAVDGSAQDGSAENPVEP